MGTETVVRFFLGGGSYLQDNLHCNYADAKDW